MIQKKYSRLHSENKASCSKGFSLVELAVVVLIVGILASGFLYAFQTIQKQNKMDQDQANAFTITDAISKYFSRNQFYPCPAPATLASNDPNYGAATNCAVTFGPAVGTIGAACVGGVCVDSYDHDANPATPPVRVRIGMLPFRTLNMSKDAVIDAHGNRYTYAVTEPQATAAYANGNAGITLLDADAAGLPNTRLRDLVFLTHGEDSAGSVASSGALNATACIAGNMDGENCDLDGTFVSQARASVAATGLYDDMLITDIWSWLYIWDETSSDVQNIYNRAFGNMGINTNNPTEKGHIVGNIRVQGTLAAGQGRVISKDICDEDTYAGAPECFTPETLGGLGIQCPPGKAMVGIANSDTVCVSVLGLATTACPSNFSFMTDFQLEASGDITVTCTDLRNGSTTTTTVSR